MVLLTESEISWHEESDDWIKWLSENSTFLSDLLEDEIRESSIKDTVPHHVIKGIQTIGVPLVLFPGLLGNAISLAVFLWTHLKLQPWSLYLAFLNIADIVFLLTVLPHWTQWLGYGDWLVTRQGWCNVNMFLNASSAFLSIWAVVCLSVERYVVVFYPWKRRTLCTRNKTIGVLIILLIVASVMTSYPLWAVTSVKQCGRHICIIRAEVKRSIIQAFISVDTMFRFLVPAVAITLLNGRIGFHIMRLKDDKSSAKGDKSSACSPLSGDATRNENGVQYNMAVSRENTETSRSNNGHALGTVNSTSSIRSVCPVKSTLSAPTVCDGKSASSCQSTCERKSTPSTRSACVGKFASSVRSASTGKTTQRTPSACATVSVRCAREAKTTVSSACVKCPHTNKHNQRVTAMTEKYRINREKRQRYQRNATRSLWIITSLFLLFNLPQFCVRFYSDYVTIFHKPVPLSYAVWQEFALLLYYLNFSANFVMYLIVSSHFRYGLRRLTTRAYRSLKKPNSRHIHD